MAASPAQKTPTPTETPAAPAKRGPKKDLSDADRRKKFSSDGQRIFRQLERAISSTERLLKNRFATPAQVEAFREGMNKLGPRLQRAASGEVSTTSLVIPSE